MFFSPASVTNRHSSTDQLCRYLPDLEQSQSNKHHALYTNFSTVHQISKSIDLEKERIDHENLLLNSRVNQCTNLLSKAKIDASDLKHNIRNIAFGNSSDQTALQELPLIPLESVYYRLNQKPKSCFSVKKDEINILLSQIQKLEKESARLYLDENQKFQSFEQGLLRQFDSFSQKLIKEINQTSEFTLLELKIMEDQQQIHAKIKKWESQLNQEFEDKIGKLIEKIESPN